MLHLATLIALSTLSGLSYGAKSGAIDEAVLDGAESEAADMSDVAVSLLQLPPTEESSAAHFAAVEVGAAGVQVSAALAASDFAYLAELGNDVTFLQTGAGVSLPEVLARNNADVDALEKAQLEYLAHTEDSATDAARKVQVVPTEAPALHHAPVFFQVAAVANESVDGSSDVSPDKWTSFGKLRLWMLLFAMVMVATMLFLSLVFNKVAPGCDTAKTAPQVLLNANPDIDDDGNSTDEDHYPLGFSAFEEMCPVPPMSKRGSADDLRIVEERADPLSEKLSSKHDVEANATHV
jgi:hypothetical protein